MSFWVLLLIVVVGIVGLAYLVRWAIDKKPGMCLDCLAGYHGRCGGCGCREGFEAGH